MVPIVARSLPFVHLVRNIARQARHRFEDALERSGNQAENFRHPACEVMTSDGIIIGGHAAARVAISRTSEPPRWREPFGNVTVC
jgi:hypothetical protein